uniref:(California timema) hypothetical protein n=1 Tax=Timema californicum TaxID=61474 RepID=A0A7R9IZR0_TIMCA|nr:unnamed protein product [Timema californicum]
MTTTTTTTTINHTTARQVAGPHSTNTIYCHQHNNRQPACSSADTLVTTR